MGDQVSSISPPPSKPRPAPKFVFVNKNSVIDTYESFAKEGFANLLSNQAEFEYNFQKEFLSMVDVTKGPIQVRVESVVRIMTPDYSTQKREKKEYLYYTCDWEARDWLNNVIRSQTHTEGRHTQQTKRITTTFNPETGEEIVQYVKGQPQEVYTIPWDKKEAEEILFGAKTFGQDSLNITNTDEVHYTAKFPQGNPARTAFSMEDFLNLSYKELSEKSKSMKSPYIADLEKRVNPYK